MCYPKITQTELLLTMSYIWYKYPLQVSKQSVAVYWDPLSAAVWAKVCERLAESMRVEPSKEWIHGTHQTGKPEDHLPKYLGRGYDVSLPRSVKHFFWVPQKEKPWWSGFAMIWRSIWIWNKRNVWNNNEKDLEIWNPQRVWFPSMRYLLSRLPSSTGKWPPTARLAERLESEMRCRHFLIFPEATEKTHLTQLGCIK